MEEKLSRHLPVHLVARWLGCTNAYVYDLVKGGQLTAIRIGTRAIRISEKSVNEFIEENIIDPDAFFT